MRRALSLLLLLATAAHAADPPPPANVRRVDPAQAVELVGQSVVEADKTEIGHIVDVLVDMNGAPMAVVLQVAGFLGVGDRQVAIQWSALHFAAGAKDHGPVVTLSIPSRRIQSAPAYVAGKPVDILTANQPATP